MNFLTFFDKLNSNKTILSWLIKFIYMVFIFLFAFILVKLLTAVTFVIPEDVVVEKKEESVKRLNTSDVNPFITVGNSQVKSVIFPKTKESTLNIKLVGTWPGEKGSAIISHNNKTRRYVIGEVITGKTKLYSVYYDHILINRNGSIEKVNLSLLNMVKDRIKPQKTLFSKLRDGNSRKNKDPDNSKTLFSKLKDGNSRKNKDPDNSNRANISKSNYLQDTIRFIPKKISSGKTVITVYPAGDDNKKFLSLGLIPGDEIVSVNNKSVNIDNLPFIMEEIAKNNPKKNTLLTIKRNNQEVKLIIDFNKQNNHK